MAVNETFRASIIGQLTPSGTAIVFDFGYRDPSGSAHVDCGTAAGNFQTLMQSTFANALPSAFIFVRYRFACVSGAHDGEIGYTDVIPPVTGALGPEMLPPEIAISMKRNTGHASRRDRGRIFFGPVSPDYRQAPDNDLVLASATELINVSNKLKADLVTGATTLKPVILAADGSYSGNDVIQVAIGPIFVHHKSRRTRGGV